MRSGARARLVLRRKVQVFLYRRTPSGIEVLLLKRAKTDKGDWHPVTGNVEPHEKILTAAIREVEEETGLSMAIAPLGVTFTYEQKTGPRKGRYHETAYAARVEAGKDVELSDEHTSSEWVSPDTARERLSWPDQLRALDALVAAYG
jgi:8-oxo-dGTP diphosphatase